MIDGRHFPARHPRGAEWSACPTSSGSDSLRMLTHACLVGTVAAHRPRRLARPRTPAFHVGNTGSNPVGDANKIKEFLPSARRSTPAITPTGLKVDSIANGFLLLQV